MNYTNTNLYRDIDETCKTVTLGLNTGKYRIELERNARKPSVFGSYLGNYIMNNYHIPSTKYAIKLQSTLKNDLKTGDIMTGEYSEIVSEASIPPLS